MSNARTAIEWTDRTWNPVTGCSRVSPGCENCYAEAVSLRFGHTKKPWTAQNAAENVVCHPERLDEPLSWRKPSRIFVNSMSDLFHPNVPNEFIDRVFARMAVTPRHTYQILTKRPERMRDYITRHESAQVRIPAAQLRADLAVCLDLCRDVKTIPHVNRFSAWKEEHWPDTDGFIPWWPLPNVWLGVSVEDQRRADERIPLLLETPAAVRFLSCEPLLGPVDLFPWLTPLKCPHGNLAPEPDSRCVGCGCWPDRAPIDWIIAGGESGPNFRPLDLEWARSLRDQCVDAGVAFFFKQVGGRTPKAGGCLLDGREHKGFPATPAAKPGEVLP